MVVAITDPIQAALDRLLSGRAEVTDQAVLREAIASGTLIVARGDRSVALGGDATGAVFVTGDGNVVMHLDASGLGVIDALLMAQHGNRLHQLPSDAPDFQGRPVQVDRLLALLEGDDGRAVITALDGMGGLGKTALAVHVGHRLRARYPDGQLFVDLAGTSRSPLDPAGAMTQVIRSFAPAAQLPDTLEALAPLYRSVLDGKRVLVVFDNAAESGQVAPLVPPSTCGVIVTSRRPVALPGAERVELDLMAPQEARALLQSIVGPDRAGEGVLDRIAALCGYLPLALRVAGSFLRINRLWSIEDYAAALSDERERLTRMALEGDPKLNVLASMAPSLQTLRQDHPQTADLWHRLAVFEGDFALDAAAAIWAVELADARDQMQRLVTWAMVMADPQTARFQLHDLMRDLALGHVPDDAGISLPEDLEGSLSASRRMHAEHYAGVLVRADSTFLEGGANVLSALMHFDGERPNIEAGYGWAFEHRDVDAQAAQLCMAYPLAGANVLRLRQPVWERIEWLSASVTSAREIGDRRGEGAALGNLGLAHADLGDARRAIEYHGQALVVSREIGDRHGEGAALGNLGLAHAALGDARWAIEFYEQHLEIAREIGDRHGEGAALGNLGLAHAALGDARRAIEYHGQALVVSREIGDRRGEGNALGNLGLAHAALGDARRAIEFYEQQLVIVREIGDRRGEGAALGNLGNAHADLGDARRAIEYHGQALVVSREIGDRRGEGAALGNLGNAHAALGDARRAIEFYEQNLEIGREIGDRRGEGNALGNLGTAHAALGDARRAIEFYEQRIEIAREIGDRRGEGAALGNLGLAHAALGDARRAIEFYEQNLEIAREIGDRRGEGAALGNLGNAHADLGDARWAIEYHGQALVVSREIGDRRGEGQDLGNLGLAHAALGDARRAIEFYEQHLEMAREIGDRRGEGAALGNLGNAHADLGDARRAIEYHGQALVVSREIGDRRGEGQDLGNLGLAHAALGDARRAIEFLSAAREIFAEIDAQHLVEHVGQILQQLNSDTS